MRVRRNVWCAVLLLAFGCGGGTVVSMGDSAGDAATVGDRQVAPETEEAATEIGSLPDLLPEVEGEGTQVQDWIEPGAFGSACTAGADCASGLCIRTTAGMQCTGSCVDECPLGFACVPYEGGGPDILFVCVDPFLTLCRPCVTNSDCQGNEAAWAGEKCASYGVAGSFCSRPCAESEDCPAGYVCEEAEDSTGASSLQCVFAEGECGCTQWFADEGAATGCSVESEWGTCAGTRGCTAAGLSACSAPIPAKESCNGLDDDCDGQEDEGTGGGACPLVNEFGTCPGTTLCLDGTESCQGGQAAPEQCDGLDNNCNGTTDEGFPDADGDGTADCLENDKDNDLVPDYLDNCPSVPNPEQKDFDLDTLGDVCDPDDDGDKAADSVDCAPLDDKVYPGATELCDGKDNDCNYIVDEGFPDTDFDGWKDCTDPDDDNDGAVDAADCSPLAADVHPGAAELCNGKDDDCDFDADEAFPDLDGDGTADCVDADVDGDGVANGPDNCPSVSNPGQGDTDQDLVGDACDPDADGDSIPDAMDNCPGLKNPLQTDLDEDGLGNPCDPDLDGDGVDNGKDNCPLVANPDQADADGDKTGDVCEVDKDGDGSPDSADCAPLDPAVHPGAVESCNGVDDNCNGTVDEGAPDLDADGLKNCIDPDDDGDGDPDDADCAPLNPAVHHAAVESCNGLDDDCDGQTDEGLGSLSCGKGSCAHKVQACLAGPPQTCDPFQGIQEEVCDGVDNDCDGLTDEDQGKLTCGLGLCVHTVPVCQDGKENVCDPTAGAAEESCDGKDNDCDGAVDEELGQLACGKGICFHTVKACIGGEPQQCNPFQGALQETCDGLDNDCDGGVDEGLGEISCGLGPCQHTVPYCGGGKVQQCNAFEGAAVEECDGVDNDCDGLVDEDLGFASCGLGVCFHIVKLCKGGVLQQCDPFAGASAETCDGVDNDCDGAADDGLGELACGVGECQHSVPACKEGKPNTCDPLEGAAPEACDGVDNDCDGGTDESFPDLDADGQADCIDIDDDGDGDPDATDCAPLDPSIGSNQKEKCFDGVDNDCDGSADDDPECTLKSCAEILASNPALPSGTYFIDPDGGGGKPPFSTWCDMKLDGGGWTLVWKHAYYEVGAPSDSMRFYSTYLKECKDTSAGWCNVPAKLSVGKSRQLIVASHQGTIVYAYRGDLNPKLDTSWEGAILKNAAGLVDQCIYNVGVAPEPETGAHAIPGLTFDKATPNDYVSNCDTDRYGGGNDCRWENCGLPGNISPSGSHVQMTVLIYVR
ncbi:MAG: hypothetical protein FJ109_12480 [Deltaproteobacteria bacterium]|nr:hypothetical protein [Deltaproteobacteria bacterium]